MILDALSVLLVIIVPVAWTVAVILAWASRRNPEIVTLRERAMAQIVLASIVTVGGLLGLTRLRYVVLPGGGALVLLVVVFVAASLPGIWWLYLYLSGRFGPVDQ